MPVDRTLKLFFRHLRAPLDPHALGLFVELVPRPTPWRFVPERRPPRRPDEMSVRERREDSRASPDRARSLLTVRAAISLALSWARSLLEAVLDVLVLAFALVAPGFLRHGSTPFLDYEGVLPIARAS